MSDFSQTGRSHSQVRRHSTVRQTGVRADRPESDALVASGDSRRALPTVLSLVVSLGLLGLILSGFFRVSRVQVVGAGLPTQQIVAASGVQGENVFSVRSDEVVSRLASVGWITVQRVDTSLPGQVTIYARRRVAMVGWKQGSVLYLLDPDGRIIAQVRATALPIITSAGGGERLGPGAVAAVREAVQVVPSAPHGAIASFSYGKQSGLTIVGTEGWHAIIGTGAPQAMVTRVAALVDFLTQTANRPGLQIVDLRGSHPHATYAQ